HLDHAVRVRERPPAHFAFRPALEARLHRDSRRHHVGVLPGEEWRQSNDRSKRGHHYGSAGNPYGSASRRAHFLRLPIVGTLSTWHAPIALKASSSHCARRTASVAASTASASASTHSPLARPRPCSPSGGVRGRASARSPRPHTRTSPLAPCSS